MDTGRPEEVTVIVYQGRNLQGKKKGRGKFHVVFSIGGNKFKSEVVDDPDGEPQWDNEAEIAVDNPQDPLILKVKEKDDIIGQVVIPLAELPTKRNDRQRCVPLQPHKKCPHPVGELVFTAWISRKGAPQHITEPVADAKRKSATLDPASLQHMSNMSGSSASLASSEKKKSMMKKLKGKLSHSPKLGGRKLSMMSTSMSNLSPPMSLSVPVDPDNEPADDVSLHSQESTKSGPRKLSGVQRLKHKFGKSPLLSRKMSKSSSKSMNNLAMLDPDMKFSATHGSNESLKSSKSNKSAGSKGLKGLFGRRSSMKPEKPIPAQFDLSKPSNHLLQELQQEDKEQELFGAVPFNPQEDVVPKKPPRVQTSHSRSSSQSSSMEDSPFQRRQNSLSARKRPDLSHRSPALMRNPSPLIGGSARHHDDNRRKSMAPGMDLAYGSPERKNRNVFAINADMNDDLWKDVEDDGEDDGEDDKKKFPPKSPLLDKSAAITERDEGETGGDRHNPFEENKTSTLEKKDSVRSATNPFDESSKAQTSVLDTPSQKKKIAAPFVFSPSDDEGGDEKKAPEISGVSPREGSTEGSTRITIRGEDLGKSKDDIVTLTVCGVNCLPTLEYFSCYKLICTSMPRKPGSGKIVIETKSGGLARSTIDYIFVQPKQVAPPKPARDHKKEKSPPKEILQNFMGKDPSPPKEVMAKRDDADTKMAVVEPMSRSANVQTVKGHTRVASGGDLKRQAPAAPPSSQGSSSSSSSREISSMNNEDRYKKEDLLKIIRNLQSENQKLKDETSALKGYMDNLLIRIMNTCPQLLCTDDAAAIPPLPFSS